jgi:hypothetical protein
MFVLDFLMGTKVGLALKILYKFQMGQLQDQEPRRSRKQCKDWCNPLGMKLARAQRVHITSALSCIAIHHFFFCLSSLTYFGIWYNQLWIPSIKLRIESLVYICVVHSSSEAAKRDCKALRGNSLIVLCFSF